MNKTEAKQQVEAFFSSLGESASLFEEKNYVQARIGETMVGFEFVAAEELLSAQALIYRFRSAPKDKILDAVFAEENEVNTGGGRVVFDSENSAFYLQQDFIEKISEQNFYQEINNLAQASLIWSSEILAQAAEKANTNEA